MIKHTLAILLASGLVACSTAEKQSSNVAEQTLTAKEQVAGIEKMCGENMAAMKNRQEERLLYTRLGEREGIEKFSINLYAAHKANEKISHLFANVNEKTNVKNVTNFVVANSGGGGQYMGGSMAGIHQNMDITHEDFLAAGGDVQSVLKGLGHGDNEIQEVVCFLVSFVPEVVTR